VIVFSTVERDGEQVGRCISHLPGLEGTRELYAFCQALGADWSRVQGKTTPDESIELRSRTLKRAEKEEGARELPETDIAEVLLYKRYLHATSEQDRIDRRLVARMVIALVDMGYSVEKATDASAANFGLMSGQAYEEVVAAMQLFSGGYATWRDDPGTPEKCSRCRREFRAECSCNERPVGDICDPCETGGGGLLEKDVDGFYRCEPCCNDVREERHARDLIAQLSRGGFREVM
jgi:hypothetical protein